MKKIFFILLIAVLFYSCNQNNEGNEKKMSVEPIPMKDFFRNPEKSSFKISPDGVNFAYLAPYQNRMNLFVRKIEDENPVRLTEESDRDILAYFWANNNKILYLKDVGGNENYKLYGVNIDGSDLKCYTCFDNVRTQVIDDLPEIEDEIIIGMNKRNPALFDAYRLNLESGELELIAENPGNIQGWLSDHEGKLRVAVAVNGLETSILYREKEDQPFDEAITYGWKDELNPLFFSFDNKYVYASSNLNRDKKQIVKIDLSDGAKELEVLFSHPDVDVSSLHYSRKRKVLTYVSYTTWKTERKFFDKEYRKLYERLKQEFKDVELAITSSNKNEDKFIFMTYGDKSRGTYYYYDIATDEIKLIHEISPWLDKEQMAEMKPVKFQSRDGLTINGYLTMPLGSDGKNLPVVINPHGGPWYRDTWGFNPEVQFLANRGFAVMQINFRGSTGYGKSFLEASYKEWGKDMQNDITDGVKWLIDEGIANPDKVAIYGASYGGYAVLAGLTFTPDLYAAGIDYVGVSNLFTFMNTIPPYWEAIRPMLYARVGDPVKDSTLLYEASPVFHADKITAPLLIAQGANDPRVNKAESDQMVEALRKRGIDVEYIVKDNEGHGFRNEENRFEFYEKMEQFLNKHVIESDRAE
jgi:dipeptidyl aminopeptidase/acylaminoacyl peptidase